MKRVLILTLAASCCAMAQQDVGNVMFQNHLPPVPFAFGAMAGSATPVKGAPYSATITTEWAQTLSDGTHITQSSSGSTARDSQGRTRQDAPLPAIGNLSVTDAPHLVILQDPVAGASYTLNLTDKTAWKNPMPPAGVSVGTSAMTTATAVVVRSGNGVANELPPPPPMVLQKRIQFEDDAEVSSEDLGSQTIEGVQATGVRSTLKIATGKIGNDRPITITTEVWTSPELKTIVYSKRNDPRTGEQTFKLTNIQRTEPDPSLFAVPSDFKITDGGGMTFFYKTKP